MPWVYLAKGLGVLLIRCLHIHLCLPFRNFSKNGEIMNTTNSKSLELMRKHFKETSVEDFLSEYLEIEDFEGVVVDDILDLKKAEVNFDPRPVAELSGLKSMKVIHSSSEHIKIFEAPFVERSSMKTISIRYLPANGRCYNSDISEAA